MDHFYGGRSVVKNEKLALSLHETAAKKGIVNSQYNMGIYNYFGQGCSVNYDKAYYWFNLAAKNGDTQAKTKLAYCYLKGHGTLQNTFKYMELIQAASTGGDIEALACLGIEYLEDFQRRDIALKSLQEPWADTTSSVGKLIITVMAGIAEFERDLIHQRSRDGREAA